MSGNAFLYVNCSTIDSLTFINCGKWMGYGWISNGRSSVSFRKIFDQLWISNGRSSVSFRKIFDQFRSSFSVFSQL